tara:strand:- start:8854 stop:9195 length:342 start_codon:yes stop_codon:yes gene_type:complete
MDFKHIVTSTPKKDQTIDDEAVLDDPIYHSSNDIPQLYGLPYASRMITAEASPGYSRFSHPIDWLEEYRADVNFHFYTLTKVLSSHFPDKMFNDARLYKDFEKLAFTSSSSFS